ncbi:MAG TPA: helix-turn-helix transcriptional regulator [Chryseolinea sp.]|nr:helix-turn-helix transcriptional regulator [Chryseolinea sp.]
MNYENHIAHFVKYNRNKLRLTQEELAEKAGVGLRFVRDLEQGKETLRMDKINQVLQLFGYTITPGPGRIKDPYDILINHFNRNVHIYLRDESELFGFIIDNITEDNVIVAWKFVSNNNAIEYQKTKNPALESTIPHALIENIENIQNS